MRKGLLRSTAAIIRATFSNLAVEGSIEHSGRVARSLQLYNDNPNFNSAIQVRVMIVALDSHSVYRPVWIHTVCTDRNVPT